MIKLLQGAFLLFFGGAFGAALYLQACTASITSAYLPDIWKVRWISPGLVSLVAVLLGMRLKFGKGVFIILVLIGLFECAGIVGLVWTQKMNGWSRLPVPVERSLVRTVEYSVRSPSFSNRSYGVVFLGGLGHVFCGTFGLVFSGVGLGGREDFRCLPS